MPIEARWLTEKFGDGEYKDILGLCKCASIEEIEQKGWSLTPGAYVGVAPVADDGVDFAERMAEIHKELLALQVESNELMKTISKNMEEMEFRPGEAEGLCGTGSIPFTMKKRNTKAAVMDMT